MMLPGLISVAFYRRRPSWAQIVVGLVPTVVLSGLFGYVSPGGPLGRDGSVAVAIAGSVALYFGILWYLFTRYRAKAASTPTATERAAP